LVQKGLLEKELFAFHSLFLKAHSSQPTDQQKFPFNSAAYSSPLNNLVTLSDFQKSLLLQLLLHPRLTPSNLITELASKRATLVVGSALTSAQLPKREIGDAAAEARKSTLKEEADRIS
jgi:hypothetical protein